MDNEGAAGTTRASAVYDALRNDILQGVFKPSEKLRVELMGKRHGVGASPVREALSRLSAEGLVSRNEQRGFSVAALVWEDLTVLTQTRCDVQSQAFHIAPGLGEHRKVLPHQCSNAEPALLVARNQALGREPTQGFAHWACTYAMAVAHQLHAQLLGGLEGALQNVIAQRFIDGTGPGTACSPFVFRHQCRFSCHLID